MENKTKICSKCKIEKNRTEFSKNSSKKDGLQSRCKYCDNKRLREEYHSNIELSRVKVRNNRKRRIERDPNTLKRNYERQARYAKNNRVKVNKMVLTCRKKRLEHNPGARQKERERNKKFRKEHPELVNFYNANRRARKLQATPIFADKTAIRSLYKQADDLSKSTGKKFHVDHIVPLISPIVCGLHWEGNLQVIPAEENLKKSNKIWPDMP